jgi:hypothetical protein
MAQDEEEDPVLQLMQEAVECFEALLALLCKQPAHVTSCHPTISGKTSICLVGQVAADDLGALEDRSDDVALTRLAKSIGDESGIAPVSFQLVS